jgi:hypothetical protein
VVALPVRENTYSGATTVLLQALALGKPVVVSRTSAIATGYGLWTGRTAGWWRLATPRTYSVRERRPRRRPPRAGARRARARRSSASSRGIAM